MQHKYISLILPIFVWLEFYYRNILTTKNHQNMFIQRSILEFALIAGTFGLLPLKNVDAQEKMRTQKEADKKYCY